MCVCLISVYDILEWRVLPNTTELDFRTKKVTANEILAATISQLPGRVHTILSDWCGLSKWQLPTRCVVDIRWGCGCWGSRKASLWPLGKLGLDNQRSWRSSTTYIGRLGYILGILFKLSVYRKKICSRYVFDGEFCRVAITIKYHKLCTNTCIEYNFRVFMNLYRTRNCLTRAILNDWCFIK